MIKFIYDPIDGEPIRDGQMRETTETWARNDGAQIVTSNLLAVLMLGQFLEKRDGTTEGFELYFRSKSQGSLTKLDPYCGETELPSEFKEYLDTLMNGLGE